MATRQTSSSGKPKSPRVQVVLPEDLCARLSALAERESRTVSNMAKVILQEGIKNYEECYATTDTTNPHENTEQFRSSLEAQASQRLKGAPRRLRLYRSSSKN